MQPNVKTAPSAKVAKCSQQCFRIQTFQVPRVTYPFRSIRFAAGQSEPESCESVRWCAVDRSSAGLGEYCPNAVPAPSDFAGTVESRHHVYLLGRLQPLLKLCFSYTGRRSVPDYELGRVLQPCVEW